MWRALRRSYRTMSREEYRDNQKLAVLAKKVDRLEMPDMLGPDGKPLKNDEKVLLHAVPEQPVIPKDMYSDPLFSTLMEYKPDLLFLQFNPMHFLMRQRYVTHKLAMKGTDEYDKKATYSFDNPIPLTWDECVVNLITLDMLRENKSHEDIDLTKALATYSYPTLQAYDDQKALTEPFIRAIKEHVAGNEFSRYHYLNNILFTSLMGKSKVVLGDMPEPLLRMQLGNTLPLDAVKDIFKFVVEKLNQHYAENPGVLVSMEDMTLLYFPHIFHMPRDLYLTAMIKEVAPASRLTAAFVGAPHYVPIQRYWVGAPSGINYTQATYVPPRIPNETNEMLIEKQALFDILLDSKVWGAKYLTNPFPYITDSIEDLSKEDRKYFKQTFFKMIQKYSAERDSKLAIPEALIKGESKKEVEKLAEK